MNSTEQILAEIDEFLTRTGMAPSTFGLAVRNDPHLVRQLRDGTRSITLPTVDKIRAVIRHGGRVPIGEAPPASDDPPDTPPEMETMGAHA